jgi:hypothetical protein
MYIIFVHLHILSYTYIILYPQLIRMYFLMYPLTDTWVNCGESAGMDSCEKHQKNHLSP